MTPIEVEILMLDNALKSAREHSARCKRRRDRVKHELDEANLVLAEADHAVRSLERSITNKRQEFLLRSVV
jgi:hypothetical protein